MPILLFRSFSNRSILLFILWRIVQKQSHSPWLRYPNIHKRGKVYGNLFLKSSKWPWNLLRSTQDYNRILGKRQASRGIPRALSLLIFEYESKTRIWISCNRFFDRQDSSSLISEKKVQITDLRLNQEVSCFHH